MFYLYRVNYKDGTFYLAITEKKPPKKSIVLVKSPDRDEFSQIAMIHHKNTVNDPRRVQIPPKQERQHWHHLPAAIEKIRRYRTNKSWSTTVREKISRSLKKAYAEKKREPNRCNRGQKFSAETRARMSRAHSDRPRIRCEHCGSIAALNMYHRWHGENCRMNW